jgi:hypothetical protein
MRMAGEYPSHRHRRHRRRRHRRAAAALRCLRTPENGGNESSTISESRRPVLWPNILKELRAHGRIAHRVRNGGVIKIVLEPPRIHSLVRQDIAGHIAKAAGGKVTRLKRAQGAKR